MNKRFIKIDSVGESRASLGICMSYEYYRTGLFECYLFINLIKWSISIGVFADSNKI